MPCLVGAHQKLYAGSSAGWKEISFTLLSATARLFYKSKEQLLKDNSGSYLYIWTSRGRVLAKQTMTADPIEIPNETQLQSVAEAQ